MCQISLLEPEKRQYSQNTGHEDVVEAESGFDGSHHALRNV